MQYTGIKVEVAKSVKKYLGECDLWSGAENDLVTAVFLVLAIHVWRLGVLKNSLLSFFSLA